MEARIHKLMDSYRAGELERLTAADCIDEYAISFVTSRDDVILVHELEGGKDDDSNKNSDRNITFHQTAYTQTFIQFSEPFQWICNLTVSDMIYPKPCRPKLDAIREAADNWQPNHHRIEYCLSKPMPQLCRVNFNIFLAVGVILCNLIKMLVLGYIALYLSPDRLLVLGDAIQSFIAHPDLRSRESSLASRKIVRDTASQAAGKPWTGVRTLQTITKRRLTPVGTTQWTVGVLL